MIMRLYVLPSSTSITLKQPTERAIVGSYLGTNAEYAEMLEFSAEHGVRPMIEVVPASKVRMYFDGCWIMMFKLAET